MDVLWVLKPIIGFQDIHIVVGESEVKKKTLEWTCESAATVRPWPESPRPSLRCASGGARPCPSLPVPGAAPATFLTPLLLLLPLLLLSSQTLRGSDSRRYHRSTIRSSLGSFFVSEILQNLA